MIQMGSMLTVADNSGAKKICCILPLGGGVGVTAQIGDVITASVKEAIPGGTVKRKMLFRPLSSDSVRLSVAKMVPTFVLMKMQLCLLKRR